MHAFFIGDQTKMKKTISGVEYDSEKAKLVTNYDDEKDRAAYYLRVTDEGEYFLHTETLKVRSRRGWRPGRMDGSALGLPRNCVKRVETITPFTEPQALDWFLGSSMVPKPFAKLIRELIGEVVSVDLGDLLEPLDRYRKAHGVSRQSVIKSAIMEDLMRPREITEAGAAVAHLQKLVGRRFGTEFNTDAGEGTIFISHDAVSMTNAKCSIVAKGSSSIARALANATAERK